ncbi:hypothetical protein ABZY16_24065 [Streptomyces sp. NPDC006553]|uniref:hypothetical protein n=1 Tax=Streptomyces sp. NPDC006553 TaxID=3157180 RepID=UPI0033A47387
MDVVHPLLAALGQPSKQVRHGVGIAHQLQGDGERGVVERGHLGQPTGDRGRPVTDTEAAQRERGAASHGWVPKEGAQTRGEGPVAGEPHGVDEFRGGRAVDGHIAPTGCRRLFPVRPQ